MASRFPRPGKLFWKLFLGNAVLMAVVLASCLVAILVGVHRYRVAELNEFLGTQAATIARAVQDRFGVANREELQALVKGIASESRAAVRITLILQDGRVIADSEAEPATLDLHMDRPEVRDAIVKGYGRASRWSDSLSRNMEYVAVRVGSESSPRGAVRVAMAQRTIDSRDATTRKLMLVVACAGLAATAALALGLALLMSKPIRRITAVANGLSRGDLSVRLDMPGDDEIATLAGALNRMRNGLATQVATIDRQRRTLESLLTQLQEGVIVAGADGRVVLVNPAAVRMLGDSAVLSAEGCLDGQAVEQCIAHHELRQLLLPSRSGRERSSRRAGTAAFGFEDSRVLLEGPAGPVSVLARASDIALPSPGEEGTPAIGRLLVLTDITELTRMMQVRADFAANASHELRTPLSAIRGAVETLMQIDPAQDPAVVRQFLQMIDRHTERMQAMVADLLDLSRIETSPTQFKPAPLHVREVLDELRSRFAQAVEAKTLRWSEDLPANLETIHANAHLLRLVLDNLVDNAIKFTEPGGGITVAFQSSSSAGGDEPVVSISVSDTGCGIPEEEQDRVFERFYQVQRSRSGPQRGTGLGLSIVRHAVVAMHGAVTLRSKLGQGTTVTITLLQS